MKSFYTLISALIVTLSLSAQEYSYRLDTIKVDKNDSRNIHRYQNSGYSLQKRDATEKPIEENPAFFDIRKMRLGANLGLSLSKNYTYLNVGPQVGYEFSKYFMAGVGVRYYYTKTRAYTYQNEYLFRNNLLGANVFGYCYPVSFIVLFAQPEINYLWASEQDVSTGKKEYDQGWVPSLIVGGGLRLGSVHITLNYDLANHPRSPYPKDVFLGLSAFF